MLWYVGYGSNLDRHRFRHYLDGGAAPGAARAVPGARDPRPPADERAVTVPGSVFFGWESPTWGGGIAFLDAEAEGTAYGRAYLLTDQQFADVAAQEMHREPGEELDVARVLEHRSHTYGPGRYETVHLLGELDGSPLLTFTAEHGTAIEPNEPVGTYLAMLARGLRDTHGLDDHAVVEYLLARPGIGRWTRDSLRELLASGGQS